MTGARALIEDLGSKNRMYVRSKRTEGRRTVADGDEIRLGSAVLIFSVGSPLGLTETRKRASR